MNSCRPLTLACRLHRRSRIGLGPVRWFRPATVTKCESCPPPEPPVPNADHRALGAALDLFSVTKYSPGSPFLHPDGAHIFLKLQAFLRAQYAAFGFEEVITPIIYKKSLWEKSGHWANYKNDMFEVTGRGASGVAEGKEIGEDEEYGLKPMNCPGHCLLFKSRNRSYRDLPIRYADFSPLHRNEISGALSGLTRVRRFHQDDGHIFCQPSQVGMEIQKALQLIDLVYGAFGLGPYKLVLSTRPDSDYIGTIEEWDLAESQLRAALDASTTSWALNPADGAFYGPKIDIILRDSTGKEHQTATIQLDFQLPARFDLTYAAPPPYSKTTATMESTGVQIENHRQESPAVDTSKPSQAPALARPILIHRAVLGSFERFLALLTEHTQGHWPFWLSPRQAIVIPVDTAPETVAHASDIVAKLRGSSSTGSAKSEEQAPQLQPLDAIRYRVDTDWAEGDGLGARIRAAKLQKYNLICVIGSREAKEGTVTVDFEGTPQRQKILEKCHEMQDEEVVNTNVSTREKAEKGQKRNGKAENKVILSLKQLEELMQWMCKRYM